MIIIGIAGGSGSGKTSVVRKILETIPGEDVQVIAQDAYYKDQGHLTKEQKLRINFDHPSSIEFDLLNKHLSLLKDGEKIDMPTYSYVSCSRLDETIEVSPSPILIIEGILIFTNKTLCDLCDIKIFVDADADNRLIRIIRRDTNQRGRNYTEALRHYERYVKPMHEQFIEPTKRFADIIVPHGASNKVAIDMIVKTIESKIRETE